MPHSQLCALSVLDKQSWQDFGGEASLYRTTTFCLLPTGDIPSRKAVFDMLLAGCIPVVFDRRQIDIYTWHLSPEEIKAIHIFVDIEEALTMKILTLDVLTNVSHSSVVAMRSAIKQVAWKLQYALPPPAASSWVPPKDDALEIILNKLFRLASRPTGPKF